MYISFFYSLQCRFGDFMLGLEETIFYCILHIRFIDGSLCTLHYDQCTGTYDNGYDKQNKCAYISSDIGLEFLWESFVKRIHHGDHLPFDICCTKRLFINNIRNDHTVTHLKYPVSHVLYRIIVSNDDYRIPVLSVYLLYKYKYLF